MAAQTGGCFRATLAGRRVILALLSILVLFIASLLCFTPIIPRSQRQSAVRAVHFAQLRDVAQAMQIYAAQFGGVPTLEVLAARGELSRDLRTNFEGVVHSHGAAQPARQLLIAEPVPLRAVTRGEPWGGPGETAQQDFPAIRTLLWSDGVVEQIEEPVFQRDFAPFVTFAPLP